MMVIKHGDLRPSRHFALCVGASLAYFLLVAGWSTGIRFNAAPDEYSHFFLVEYILHAGFLPHPGVDPAIPFRGVATGALYHAGVFWYYGMPNLHSLGAAATAYGWIDIARLPPSPLAVRIFNWCLSIPFFLALVTVARMGARLAVPASGRNVLPLLLALVVALIPQVVFIFAYFNADAFGLTVLTLALAALLRVLEKPRRRTAVVCGATLGLLMCAKIYFLPAVALIGTLAAAYVIGRPSWPVRSMAAICLATALAIAMPALTATWAWYGDATGMLGQHDFMRLFGSDPSFMKGTCFIWCNAAIVDFPKLWWWLALTFKSFFYDLGWVDIVLPVRAYQLFFLPLCIGLFVASVAVMRAPAAPDRRWQPVVVVGFWMLLVGVIAANLIGSQRLLPQPQGRYLYAALPFVPLLGGVASSRPTTRAIMVWVVPLSVVVMFSLNLVGARAMRAASPHPIETSPASQSRKAQCCRPEPAACDHSCSTAAPPGGSDDPGL